MKVLTVKETAEVLKVKPQWVYRMIRRDGLPFVRLGRQIRIDEDSLERWLTEHTVVWRDVDRKDAGSRAIDSPDLKAN
jgi:excisionase family DNA binding protein